MTSSNYTKIGVTISVVINQGLIGNTKTAAGDYQKKQGEEQEYLYQVEQLTGENLLVDIQFEYPKVENETIANTGMQVKIIREDGQEIKRIPLGNDSIDENGTYEVTYIDKGETSSYQVRVKGLEKGKTYDVIIAGLGYLPCKETIEYNGQNKISVSNKRTNDIVAFIAGNVDNDEKIGPYDMLDINTLGGTKRGEERYKISLDFNRDGIVDKKDKEIVSNHYGASLQFDINGDGTVDANDVTYANEGL